MKNFTRFLFLFTFSFSLFQCQKEDKDKDSTRNALILLAATRSSVGSYRSNDVYDGFADIPSTLYSNPATVTTSTNTRATTQVSNDTTGKYKDTYKIYQPARDAIRSSRTIIVAVSKLVTALNTIYSKINSAGVSLPYTCTSSDSNCSDATWDGQSAKYRFKNADSTVLSGGRHMEVWYNTSTAPYSNLKAAEFIYRDNTASNGKLEGRYWGRVKNAGGSMSIYHIDFSYDPTTATRNMSLIAENIESNGDYSGKIHVFVQESSNATKIDGTYLVNNHEDTLNKSKSDRAYVFTAAGDITQGAIRVAFPLQSSTDTDAYASGNISSIAEVWADYLLYYLANNNIANTTTSYLTGLKLGYASGCGSLTAPTALNATSNSGSTAAELKTCYDAILAKDASNNVKNTYYLVDLQNPAYYTASGNTVTLTAMGEQPDATYAVAVAKLLSSIRNGSPDSLYNADMRPASVKTLSITTGSNIPTTAQWGDGKSGTNSTNGSANNTADF